MALNVEHCSPGIAPVLFVAAFEVTSFSIVLSPLWAIWTAPLWAYSLDPGTCIAHTRVHALCMYFTYLVSSTTTQYAIAACEVNLLRIGVEIF